MTEFVARQFLLDPARHWQWMVHVVYVAKSQIKDIPLALSYASLLRQQAENHPEIPPWAAQLEIFIRANTGDLDGAKPNALKLPFHECSKGMVQKTGLIGALLSGRDLLILDEPMSGLDPFSRSQVKGQLKALKSQERTLLMCTHSLTDVEEFADRLAVLHDGRLRFIGTPEAWLISTRTESLEDAFLASIRAC